MGDSILYISLCTSITGLLILAFVSESLEPPYSKIEDVKANSIGKNVHVRGNVSDVHKFDGGSALIKLLDETSTMDVYLPYNTMQHLKKLKVGTELDFIGTIEVYQGRLEVVVEKPENIREVI